MDSASNGSAVPTDVLSCIEQALSRDCDPSCQLEDALRVLGEQLGATRVVLYGDSEAGDDAVRVRSQWRMPDLHSLPTFAAPLPLLTWRPSEDAIASGWPRGSQCPEDCMTSAVGCPLRHACASIVVPLRVAGSRFGRLGVHATTRREWNESERLLVQQVAMRLALHVAHLRADRLREQLDAQRRGIAMTVLHQVATPVSVIAGALDHVAHHGADASQPLLVAADAAVDQLRRLCDDLVAINGTSGARVTSRDVRRDLEAVVAAARRRHPDATVDLQAPPRLPLVRSGDGDVARILDALIDNAVRYSGGVAHVNVTAWSDEHVLTIRVRDDGPGVQAEAIEVIGAAFSRSDPEMRRTPGGLGLGLALASSMARRVGGDLHLDPRSDAPGAQATLCLPLAQIA